MTLAVGVLPAEIAAVMHEEFDKEYDKGRNFGTCIREELIEEVGDVEAAFAVFTHYAGIDRMEAFTKKLPILQERKWVATEHGVLIRPRKKNGEER